MGRIRTKDIKDLARDLYEAYPDSFSHDFEQNKKAMADLKITEGRSTRFRNRVAGYIVRLVRQAEHGHRAAGERTVEAKKIEETAAETAEQTEEKSE